MTLGSVSRERWRVLEPLLDAALELEPADRPRFVADACGRDARLRAELEGLIAACERADAILTEPAVITYQPLLDHRETHELPRSLGGRYHIVREIGRGGMATVYLADDPKHGRQVAVKVLHGQVARLIGRERFLREIEIAARLSHPHILPLHDSGEAPADETDHSGVLYFVSPFVTGESLRDRLQHEPPLCADDVIRLGREIAHALDYAHRQGVAHLDVKPENILLQDGHAIITDFGIARAMSNATEHSLHEPTPLLGTPSYMSPEQALGVPNVDGRSDIYSLGCVLYEIVTGSRPFGRQTVGEAVERAKAPALPDRALLIERSSREVAAVIMRAMEPSRENRFQTAGDMALALSGTVRERKIRGWRRRAMMAVCALAAIVPLAVRWARSGTMLDPDLIVIAPFEAEAPSLGLWKEGIVDVLSRNLDGAGALRAVPASTAVRRWHGRADAESARELGKRTGARLVIFGGLLEAGDSVRATAILLDASTGLSLAEFERRDVISRFDRLTDSLTIAVLRELGRSRRLDIARATSSPTTSLGALKAYLQGEQFYRVAQWDSAQTWFERALSLDTSFALAYHRLAAVRTWRDPKDVPDSMTFELMRRASWFAQGLAPRERLLATIDSMYAESEFAWRRGIHDGRSYIDERPLVGQLLATIADGLKRYPDDPELSFLLAKSRWRFDRDVQMGERDDRGLLALFDRAIELDSTFAPAYVVPISLAAYLDGVPSAQRYIRAYLARGPWGPRSETIRLDDALLDPARAGTIDLAHAVDTLPSDQLCQAAALLRHLADSTEGIVRLARAVAERHPATNDTDRIPMCAGLQLVDGLQFRGHLRDAYRIAGLTAHFLRSAVTIHLAELGVVPPDTARAEAERVLSFLPRAANVRLYRWWAEDGDTLPIQAYLNHFTTSMTRPHDPAAFAMLRSSFASGNAYLALAKRDTASALEQLLTTRDTLHNCWSLNRTAIVRLLIARERYREAADRLERRWPGTSECSDGIDDVEWTLERARMFERFGERQRAIADYDFVATVWRTADPELQPYVRAARDAAARLRTGKTPAPAAIGAAGGR
jgi:tetratricopeptide (TPR) repeat protein/TolB-like protein